MNNLKKYYLSSRMMVLNFILIIFLASLYSCSYSFTGASVPPHLKSISIPIFADRSGSGEFDLSKRMSDMVIKKFIDDNTLMVTDRAKSDAYLEGIISSLADAPSVVSGSTTGGTVASRRVTINVRIVYKDLIKKQTILDKTFSNYGDYVTTGDINSARKTAIERAIELVAEDILLAVVSNW
ncbi:MAG: LPS assembly lipoprotein LptE [Ignavibacteria bacterium]|nr:LPS assembly lipoprotein LptE [Ignavibacteria bacterium]